MGLDKRRSPDVIREYFDLLKWYKRGGEAKLSPEEVDANSQLHSIQQNLNAIKTLVAEKEISIALDEDELDKNKSELLSIEDKLTALREKIVLLQQKRLQWVEAIPPSISLEAPKQQELTAIPPLKLAIILQLLLKGMIFDLKTIYHATRLAFVANVILIIPTVLAFLITFILYVNFGFLANTVITIALIIYLYIKSNSIRKRYQNVLKQYIEDIRVRQEAQVLQQQNLSLQVQDKLRELELSLNAFENQQSQWLNHQQQLKTQRQDLISRIEADYKDLDCLRYDHQKQSNQYQQIIEELIEQKKLINKSRLLQLEKQCQEWLEKDINRLTKQAMRKLKLLPCDHIGEVGAIQTEPIRVLVGITERTSPSLLVEDDIEPNLENNITSELYIKAEEFRSEPSYDGKSRKYGVYEFLVIFLCANFLSYYKCYFNFIRSKTVNEEYSEYLYDSIVFTKIQEKSSTRLKDDDQKRVYSKRLLIATKDGKVISFRIAKFRVEPNLAIRLSQIDEAAIELRKMLRQRRIDVTLTESLGNS
ncbi:hypothetical protein NDA01_29345 [Trichocoleus desertorum AS-A10]|uniref:hypothetical protein n=1 Tax=Trichocoleus desertorum TaxID=1481672 RepID=UPI0032981910